VAVDSIVNSGVVDSAGVVTPPSCALGNRTAMQEILVSLPEAVSSASLDVSTAVPVTFNFASNPIPINATDLIVQVVYRGPLGEEADGIAIGHYGVREPSFRPCGATATTPAAMATG